jgi:multiple sugar transport system substrate-binding protein
MITRRTALLAPPAAALAAGLPAAAQANETVFLSTQLRPVEEAQKVRTVLLRGAPGRVTYVTEEPPQLTVRVRAEQQAGRRTISLIGALHGELSPLQPLNALEPLDDMLPQLAPRGIPDGLLRLGRLGTDRQLYVPWMQATYVMVAHRRALEFLPAGADINSLTYAQLAAWAAAIQQRTNQRRLAFPAGPRGLMARFFQGYLYPSFTGGLVTPFRSADAAAMWGAFRDMWASVSPASANINFMQEALLANEAWIGWDHVARVLDALREKPTEFVAFAPPAGPKGRAYMPVLAGLAVAAGAPNAAGARGVIMHLTQPSVQIATAAEVGFFPVVRAELPADLPAGVRLAADAIARTQNAPDALPALLPVGLGDKNGEFNKVFTDTFQRIVLRREDIRTVLDAEAGALRTVMEQTGAPCWAPDAASPGACPVA